MRVIVHINSYPGVGKLTIALALQKLIGGHVLDNHTVYNVALALTEPKSEAFYESVRAVKDIAYALILKLPGDVPVILTNAHAEDSAWGNEAWDGVIDLAAKRRCPLYNVVLACDPAENDRRIQSPARNNSRKPTDPELFPGNRNGRPLLKRGGDATLEFDVTSRAAEEAAIAIRDWVLREHHPCTVRSNPNGF